MNNYHIYEDIAKGKHSVIYKARKKKTIDYYAVKSMDKCKRKKVTKQLFRLKFILSFFPLFFINFICNSF